MDEERETAISAQLKAPRAGAVAGILFSILLIISVTLIRLSVPDSPEDPGKWLAGSSKSIDIALDLLPFAGISFLWFMGVLRDRMGIQRRPILSYRVPGQWAAVSCHGLRPLLRSRVL